MVEVQASAADALEEQCVSLPKLPVLPAEPDHPGGGFQTFSCQVQSSSSAGGGGEAGVGKKDGGTFSLQDGRGRRGGGPAAAQHGVKRARLDDDDDDGDGAEEDDFAISAMDLSGSVACVPLVAPDFVHDRQQDLYHHHRQRAVEATNKFSTTSPFPQPCALPLQNGHAPAPPSAFHGLHFGGDGRLMADASHRPGFLYPLITGQSAYFNVAEVLAELERERQKNAELQCRVNALEARLGGAYKQGVQAVQNGTKRSRKQRRTEKNSPFGDTEDVVNGEEHPLQVPAIKEEEVVLRVPVPLDALKPADGQDTGVTWMSREEVTPADLDQLNRDTASEHYDSGDSEDEDEDDDEDDDEPVDDDTGEGKIKRNGRVEGEDVRPKSEDKRREASLDVKNESERVYSGASGEGYHEDDESEVAGTRNRRRKFRKDAKKGKAGSKAFFKKRSSGQDVMSFRGSGVASTYKKAPKTAFCPKEVKRIMESGVLALKNAQSHTMRKIIVFASLGIRHGCEDMYDLDFTHFSVVQRGEPHKSSKEPGEHVLYDNPGVRRKIFYPNPRNPVLCPVRILDEEKAMRPTGLSCPTCLFLCIKYGGRTRNLPQNEYVRQRMGRNKLKSFGPLMCQMNFLMHIRTGSFFFKALGITLLFMAGFPDDLVRKETKYRNLDLLQKYYRSDDKATGEQLFHPYPTFPPQVTMAAPLPPQKAAMAARSAGKKGPPPLLSKPPSSVGSPAARYLQPLSARPPSAVPFRALPPSFSSPLSSNPAAILPVTATLASSNHTPAGPQPTAAPPLPPFGIYHSHYHAIQGPMGGFAPMPWPAVSAYAPGPYRPPPPAFGFPAYSTSPQFMPPFYAPAYRPPPYGHPQQPAAKEPKREEPGESGSAEDNGSCERACPKRDEIAKGDRNGEAN